MRWTGMSTEAISRAFREITERERANRERARS
jgi:hypothetical protein